jgi:polyferredoxin
VFIGRLIALLSATRNLLPRASALLLGLTIALVLASGLTVVSSAQGSGERKGLGQGQHSGQSEGAGNGLGSSRAYFGGDQLLKLSIMAGLAGLALGVVAVRGYRYRKWLLLVSVGIAGFYLGGLLCPLCAVQNVFLKWNTGYLLLFLLPIVLTLLVGRVYCGYVCPYGAVQELLHIGKWAPRIPARWRKLLKLLKYAVLIFLVVRVLVTGTEILKDTTPFKALFAWGGTPLTIALTAVFAVLSVFVWRPFCETLCPLGALLSLVSRVSLFRLEADTTCSSCGLCTKQCPAATCEGGSISSADCYMCGQCVRTCHGNSLRLKFRWSRRRSPFRDAGSAS